MEKIDTFYFKMLGIYSAIIGVAGAILSLIPALMPFCALFFMPFLGALIPLILLVKKDNFNSNENKTYAVLGGISGFVICGGFLFVFVPLVFLMHLINKNYYDYGISNLNLFLFVMFFIMIALVYVITNIVTGLIAGVIYTYFKGKENG